MDLGEILNLIEKNACIIIGDQHSTEVYCFNINNKNPLKISNYYYKITINNGDVIRQRIKLLGEDTSNKLLELSTEKSFYLLALDYKKEDVKEFKNLKLDIDYDTIIIFSPFMFKQLRDVIKKYYYDKTSSYIS